MIFQTKRISDINSKQPGIRSFCFKEGRASAVDFENVSDVFAMKLPLSSQ